MSSAEDTRPWSQLSEAEQETVIAGLRNPPGSVEEIEVERIDAGAWAPTDGDDDPADDYVEGVDAARGDEQP